MKFHLDENVDHAIAQGLRRRGIDVTTSSDGGLIQATDEQQLAYATSAGRVLITQDRDMLILAAYGTSHAGIAYWNPGSRSIGQIVRELLRMHQSVGQEEIANRIEWL